MKTIAMMAAVVGVLSFGVQDVVADCYGSGENWPNQEEARSFVQNACYNNGGMFTGGYAARQTKYMCPRASSNNMGLLFEVQNMNTNTGFDLGDNDCYNRLTNEISDVVRVVSLPSLDGVSVPTLVPVRCEG